MITKMKKLTFLVYHKEYETFLQKLQELGVVHVQPAQEGAVAPSSMLEEKMRETERIEELIKQLSSIAVSEPMGEGNAERANSVMQRVEELNETLRSVQSRYRRLQNDEAALLPWGDFDVNQVNGLSELGYKMYFFTCMPKAYNPEWTTLYNTVVITQDAKQVNFIALMPVGTEVLIDAEPVFLPQQSLSEVQRLMKQAEAEQEQCQDELIQLATQHLADLKALQAHLYSSIEMDKVVLATEHAVDNKVMVLNGWIPAPKEEAVKAFLSTQPVYYEIREPRRGDNVPILLRNNPITRLYETLTEMYGMPDYEEFDPTPMVAPFFTLFFGLCVGDAGYGLILVLLGLYLKTKMAKSMAGMMNLVITLGVGTTIVGAVLGTFFGASLFDINIPDCIKQFMIVGKIDGTTYDKAMFLALIIGVIHICIAMTVKAIGDTVRFGFKSAISAWSWLLFVVGFVATGGLSFFKLISEDTTYWSFVVIGGISALGIYLLNDLKRNPLVNIGAGLWDTYNMATGLLGDFLSYVRLYALGLAGGILGGVFNMMAFMLKDSIPVPGLDWLACGFILVFGHTLNIAMSCLGAFVHPLRLTFVEYFKNSGYEGTGQAYKPFSVIKNK